MNKVSTNNNNKKKHRERNWKVSVESGFFTCVVLVIVQHLKVGINISFQSVQMIPTVVHISKSNGPYLREADVLPIQEKYLTSEEEIIDFCPSPISHWVWIYRYFHLLHASDTGTLGYFSLRHICEVSNYPSS